MADSCIYEARDENILVSLKDEKSTVRIARFLKPIVRNVEQAVGVPNTPLLHELFSHSSKNWPSKVSLKGWKPPQKEWGQWVENLAGKYGAVWNQAGICDAVLSSTYEFPCNRDVILGLSEFWCPDTNTFVFPWGEVTVTLEDVLILGGFPVLGELVTMALEGDQSKKLWEEIENQRTELHKISKAKRASHGVWLEHFIEKGSDELEHVAFLCLWLSRLLNWLALMESMLDREKAVKYVVDNQEPSLNNVKMELLVQAEMKPTQVMTPNAATASELRYGSVSSKNEVDNQVSEAPRVQEEFDNKSQGTKSDAKESHVTICQDSLAEAKKMQQVPEDVNDDEFESLPPTKSSSLGDDDIDRKRKFSTTIEFKGEPIDVDDLSQEIEWRNGSKRDKKMAGQSFNYPIFLD
ncbi:hypothetical protein COLO4_22820 [Corchorus olitorius]|uniref:Aminotransferase-like plant mobile domain-containing protein n=1 Tax=Corchorus olitorius TaxID=93759 RepID=A0A1R3IJP6_9ROSI|nr:hypothetical protein COLO4_22820 [Corchorus olitorius]